jgi:polyisoprenoid-binding protein YceI
LAELRDRDTIEAVAEKKLALSLAAWFLLWPLTSPPALAEPQRYRLNPAESQITAQIADPFGKIVAGGFRLTQGEVQGDPTRLLESASVSLVVDTASYDSNIGLRNQDVVEYYLEAKQYPVIRFSGTRIEKAETTAKEAWQITLTGRLDLHGVQKEITVPVRLLFQQNKLVAQGSLRLSLADFKIAVPQLLFWKAGDRVEIDFRLVGERQP